MVQMALADGGIVSEPYRYFKEHESIYRYIDARLSGTREAYLSADRDTRRRLLLDSSNYAMLTANTPLNQADRSFEIYRDHYPAIDPPELASIFAENGIGFHTNKAKYITNNISNIEIIGRVDRLLVDGNDDEAQELLMNLSGIGPAKSAFTLAMLGWTDHICADTHFCQYMDIDPRVYEKYSADEYKDLADRALSEIPDLRNEVSDFLCQWICFDINRGEIETHDLFFRHIAEITS